MTTPEINNLIGDELTRWAEIYRQRSAEWYPEDVFLPSAGMPYTTPDAAAAAMARHVYRLVARELTERASELTTDRIP